MTILLTPFHDIINLSEVYETEPLIYEKAKTFMDDPKTHESNPILSGYIVFLFVSAAIIQLVEPDINHYGDALRYCYAVLSTAGFGDIVAITFIGKLVSVLVTIYTIFVVAIVTGVVVNYYGQIVEMQRRETAMMFLDKLERLPELSKEELEDISKG